MNFVEVQFSFTSSLLYFIQSYLLYSIGFSIWFVHYIFNELSIFPHTSQPFFRQYQYKGRLFYLRWGVFFYFSLFFFYKRAKASIYLFNHSFIYLLNYICHLSITYRLVQGDSGWLTLTNFSWPEETSS